MKRLVTPFNKTRAYELGIIDERGAKLKDPKTKEELDSFSTFERLVFNIKKIIERLPGGRSKIASYGAALFLIREHKNPKEHYTEKEILEELEKNMKYLEENDIKTLHDLLKDIEDRYEIVREKTIMNHCEWLSITFDSLIEAFQETSRYLYVTPFKEMKESSTQVEEESNKETEEVNPNLVYEDKKDN